MRVLPRVEPVEGVLKPLPEDAQLFLAPAVLRPPVRVEDVTAQAASIVVVDQTQTPRLLPRLEQMLRSLWEGTRGLWGHVGPNRRGRETAFHRSGGAAPAEKIAKNGTSTVFEPSPRRPVHVSVSPNSAK